MDGVSIYKQLQELKSRANMSVRDIALAAGYKTASGVQRFFEPSIDEQGPISLKIAVKLADAFVGRGTPPITADEVMALTGIKPHAHARTHEGSVVEMDIIGGAGIGALAQSGDDAPVAAEWGIPDSYMRGELRTPISAAKIIEVRGDSMAPTLHSGDRIMVDTRDKRPSPPGIFVVWDGIGLVVKRLEYIPNSEPARVRIISDNPMHDRYERTLDEIDIQGRVIWVARKM